MVIGEGGSSVDMELFPCVCWLPVMSPVGFIDLQELFGSSELFV